MWGNLTELGMAGVESAVEEVQGEAKDWGSEPGPERGGMMPGLGVSS